MEIQQTTTPRDRWGALIETPKYVSNLILMLQTAEHVDEHGAWEFGITSGRRDTWAALNWSCYGASCDLHNGTPLAVIQVRHSEKNKYGVQVRKSYFLIGTNEDDSAFAHPVNANVVHLAVKADADVVRASQDWVFGGDYSRKLRQGDLALLPVKRAPGTRENKRTLTIEGSHRLKASLIRRDGPRLYVRNPILTHQPGTHPEISGEGWFKLIVGRRGHWHGFAAPTVD